MDFTATQQDILYRAWLLARDGNGQVVTDEAIPDAHELAEQGWLERRTEDNGDMSWWWTPAAETALDLNGGPTELMPHHRAPDQAPTTTASDRLPPCRRSCLRELASQ